MIASIIKKSIITAVIAFIAVLLILNMPVFSILDSTAYKEDSKQVLDNIDIIININPDGSMDVKENWQVSLEYRDKSYRNIYKSFVLDNTKNISVDNFRVYDSDNEIWYREDNNISDPSQSDNKDKSNISYMYRSGNNLEMGIYMMPIHSGTRSFEMSYRVNNIVEVYNDTAVCYYQEIGPKFSLPITNMTCTINTPENVNDTALRAWLHCTAESFLTVNSDTQVSFTAGKIPPETYVETRLCMPVTMFGAVVHKTDEYKLDEIIAEETSWEQSYNEKLQKESIIKAIDIGISILLFILGLAFLIRKIIKNRHFKTDVPEYVREVPQNEDPAGMAENFYYYRPCVRLNKRFDIKKSKKVLGNMLSALILSLAHKRYIVLDVGNNEHDIKIRLANNILNTEVLTQCECTMLSLIKKVANAHSGKCFTMEEMKAYSKKNYKYISDVVNDIVTQANNECIDKGFYEEDNSNIWINALSPAAAVIAFIFSMFSASVLFIPLGLILACVCVFIGSCIVPRLSLAGEVRHREWKALKKFMLEFSNMKEYSAIHLRLWEEYLVYATAMGISKKVGKQLEIAYKNLQSADFDDSIYCNSFLYWSLFRPRYTHHIDLGSSVSHSMSQAYRTAHSMYTRSINSANGSGSSGGFGGGGFSGGGGGFGGGGGGVR